MRSTRASSRFWLVGRCGRGAGRALEGPRRRRRHTRRALPRTARRHPPQELEALLLAPYQGAKTHYGLPLSVVALAAASVDLAHLLLTSPAQGLALLDDALPHAQDLMLRQHPRSADMCAKPCAHVRVHSLPHALDPGASPLRPRLGAVTPFHLGRLLALSGTVVRAGAVRVYRSAQIYACGSCGGRLRVPLPLDEDGAPPPPGRCPRRRPDGRACNSPSLKLLPEAEATEGLTNYQELRLQERSGAGGGGGGGGGSGAAGAAPAALEAVLLDELADACSPGGAGLFAPPAASLRRLLPAAAHALLTTPLSLSHTHRPPLRAAPPALLLPQTTWR